MPPNIVAMVVDQMRGDSWGGEGHPVVETPNLDNLARQGVVFRYAYSAAPSCIPARASIFTGMSPASHGRVGYQDHVPWHYDRLLASELAQGGYHTQAVGKLHVYPTRSLMGFHNVVLHDGYMHFSRKKEEPWAASWDATDDYLPWLRQRAGAEVDLLDLGLDCNSATTTRPWALSEVLHPTNWVVTQSIDFLRRRDRERPFFLWMSFVRPHPPFDPPPAYLDWYLGQALPAPALGDWVDVGGFMEGGMNPVTRRGVIAEPRRQRAQAAYYALISHLDAQIGRFLQALYEYGVLHNTLIVFVSDHGEMLGDHLWFAKALPYEGSAHIPLVLSDPGGQLGLRRGTVASGVVELRDIMPTLLDVADLPIPSTVEGKSLIPLARGEAQAVRDYLHGEHAYGRESNHYVTDGREKYIWWSQTGVEQFFDLTQDPKEERDLARDPRYRATIADWRRRLIEELASREEGYADGEQLIAGRPPKACLSHVLGASGGSPDRT